VFWPVRGGGGVRVHSVARVLQDRGHRLSVIAPFLNSKGLHKVFPNIRIRSTGRVTRFSQVKEIRYAILMVRTFLRLIMEKADVIFAQNVVAGFPAIFAGRLLDIPVVFDMSDLLTGYSRNPFVYRFGPKLEQWVMRQANFVVVTSQNLMELGLTCSARRVEKVRNGVNLELFYPRSQNRDSIVFVGGMEVNDGVLIIPEAAKIVLRSFHDIRFECVGDGKALSPLIQKVSDLGLSSRFQFRGWMDQKDIPDVLAGAKIGLITSLKVAGTVYASPLRSIEYMAMGIPFVASDLEGIREQTEKCRGGILFRAGSAESLAESILRLLNNPALYRTLGRNGRAWVIRHADWGKNALRIAEICETLAN
jgi:glycosyltransferase involved in cell wall biosynthesis